MRAPAHSRCEKKRKAARAQLPPRASLVARSVMGTGPLAVIRTRARSLEHERAMSSPRSAEAARVQRLRPHNLEAVRAQLTTARPVGARGRVVATERVVTCAPTRSVEHAISAVAPRAEAACLREQVVISALAPTPTHSAGPSTSTITLPLAIKTGVTANAHCREAAFAKMEGAGRTSIATIATVRTSARRSEEAASPQDVSWH